jgi:hypothetical protein
VAKSTKKVIGKAAPKAKPAVKFAKGGPVKAGAYKEPSAEQVKKFNLSRDSDHHSAALSSLGSSAALKKRGVSVSGSTDSGWTSPPRGKAERKAMQEYTLKSKNPKPLR